MKSSSKVMYGLTVFLAVTAVIYILGTMYVDDRGSVMGLEWVGTTALVLSAALTMMLGLYIHITERRTDVLPEDWEEAEVADKAGTLGFFSPGSIWPAAMSGAIALLGFGIIFLYYWLIAVGALALIYTVAKLNFQYGAPRPDRA